MFKMIPIYSEDELSGIRELRHKFQDLDLDDDKLAASYLVKWLRAHNMDDSIAEAKFRKSLVWRKENQVDKILEWDVPDQLFESVIAHVSGYDKDGNAVLVVTMKDIREDLILTIDLEDAKKMHTYQIEKIFKNMKDRNEALGLTGTQIITIFDLEGFNVFSYAKLLGKRWELFKALSDIVDDHYPDLQKSVFITHAPRMFTLALAIAKPFLQKATMRRTKIFGSCKNEWIPEILAKVPSTQLSTKFGGTNSKFDEGYRHTWKADYVVPAHDDSIL